MSITETKTSLSGLDLKFIPTGYKRTELGFIPEEWSIVTLRDVCVDMLQGINTAIDKPEYSYSGVPILKANNVIDKVISLSNMEYVTKRSYTKYNQRYHVKKGDFLFSNIGARLGTGALWEHDIEATFAWNVMRIIPDTKKVYPRFLAQLINSPNQSEKIQGEQSGSGMGFIPKSIMQKVVLPFPPIGEQTAIANALSDVDALIQELEKLIAKKQAIKTATMQQLLTGRTRLPQFAHHPDGRKKACKPSELGEIPEDWEVVSIGELGQVDPENLGAGTSPNYEFDYISLEQIDKGTLLGTIKTIFKDAPSRARRVLKKGDFLVSTVRPNLMSHFFVKNDVKDTICSTGFSVVRFHDEKMCPGYLYQHLFSSVINNQIEMLISGSNYPAINSRDVRNLRVQIGQLEEQLAISIILENMDEEIQALEQRLTKTRQIKQGMMQELLTGKTRLVKPVGDPIDAN